MTKRYAESQQEFEKEIQLAPKLFEAHYFLRELAFSKESSRKRRTYSNRPAK